MYPILQDYFGEPRSDYSFAVFNFVKSAGSMVALILTPMFIDAGAQHSTEEQLKWETIINASVLAAGVLGFFFSRCVKYDIDKKWINTTVLFVLYELRCIVTIKIGLWSIVIEIAQFRNWLKCPA